MMRELFGDRRRAFFAQAGLGRARTAPSERALAEHVDARFAAQRRDAGEALHPLLDPLVGGHPQRAMLLAHHLFQRTAAGGTADSDTWSACLADAIREVAGEIQRRGAR